METLNLLNWRYATKAMNGTRVDSKKLHNILEAIRMAPTSSGLQPFEILVVSDQELKEKIKPVAFGQRQITECSDLLIFAAWDTYTAERINAVYDHTEALRGRNEGLDNYRQMLLKNYVDRDPEINFNHAAKQAYIALGIAMVAAAEEKVDTTPMEGFDPDGLDNLLDLKSMGLRSTVLLAVGHRDAEEDWLVNLKKVRRPFEEMIRTIK